MKPLYKIIAKEARMIPIMVSPYQSSPGRTAYSPLMTRPSTYFT